MNPLEIASRFRVRPSTLERVKAGHEAILAELKPSRAQLQRGLELHYDSFVADAQGGVSPNAVWGLQSDRMQRELDAMRARLEADEPDAARREERVRDCHWRCKAFESAFDAQWIEEARALAAVAGARLALEDVAHPNENTFEAALEHLARSRFVYDQREDLRVVTHAAHIERLESDDQVGFILHLAGAGCFAEADDPLGRLDLFYALGVRMAQLTYIQDNALCSSWLQEEDKGLTDLGRRAVRRMNELGVMVDIAHCGERSAFEVIEASSEPVLISHTACAAVYDDSTNEGYLDAVFSQPYARGVARPKRLNRRNAPDDLLRAVARKGGLAAIYTIDYVIGAGPESFHTWADHVEHAVEVAGADHVAVGSDRTFVPAWPPRPLDWTNWPYWTVGLVCRGFSDEDIRKIIGGNYRRYAERVLDKRPWGPLNPAV